VTGSSSLAEILKIQLATQFTVYNHFTPDFSGFLPMCLPQQLPSLPCLKGLVLRV